MANELRRHDISNRAWEIIEPRNMGMGKTRIDAFVVAIVFLIRI